MTPVIEIEGLTKSYGRHRGIIDIDLVVEERGIRLPGPQRRRQDDDDPNAA